VRSISELWAAHRRGGDQLLPRRSSCRTGNASDSCSRNDAENPIGDLQVLARSHARRGNTEFPLPPTLPERTGREQEAPSSAEGVSPFPEAVGVVQARLRCTSTPKRGYMSATLSRMGKQRAYLGGHRGTGPRICPRTTDAASLCAGRIARTRPAQPRRCKAIPEQQALGET
jgi:hypothetical protein